MIIIMSLDKQSPAPPAHYMHASQTPQVKSNSNHKTISDCSMPLGLVKGLSTEY